MEGKITIHVDHELRFFFVLLKMVYEFFKKSDITNAYGSVLKGGGNICNFCATNTNFYPRFHTFTDFPDPQTCPFPKVSVNRFHMNDNHHKAFLFPGKLHYQRLHHRR